MEITSQLRKLDTPKIDTIYFGGGTPNTLSIKQLHNILDVILKNGLLKKSAEISIELNPRLISKDYIHKALKMGFNRFSIGVQSFDNELLDFLKRNYDSTKVKQKILVLKELGVKNFGLDFMMAIPGQSLRQVLTDIKMALKFKPRHLSYYLFTYEEESEFGRRFARGLLPEPNESKTAQIYQQVCQELDQNDFIHYEISNWAQKGFECRHNLAFWKGKNYLGFGLSATSFLNAVHTKNTSDLKTYLKNPFSVDEYFPCKTRRQKQIDHIIRQTRISSGVRRDLFEEKKIRELAQKKLIQLKDRSLTLTPKGWLLNNRIIEQLIEALKKPF